MRVEIEPGVHLLGSKDGADWPLIVVDTVWPGFGYARDADPVQGRLMHQAFLFTFNTTNVSVGGGGTVDCRGGGFQGCGSDLAKPPCSGHARPQCVWFATGIPTPLAPLFSRPLFARFAPSFYRYSAVFGFLAPRRRERAKDGVKWARNGLKRVGVS